MKKDDPLVLILCGGQSLRLWPLSEYKSKNFFDIFGFSPLEVTIKRFLKITPRKNIFLIANCQERKALKKIRLINRENVFFEPESKNTAAAIFLSLQHLKKYHSEASRCGHLANHRDPQILIISPVDHLIREEEKFYSDLQKAVKGAKDGWIFTLGMKPNIPTSDFGYIQADKPAGENIFSVKSFIEKPPLSLAKKLIKAKNSFYNSGIFIASLAALDEEYRKYYPYYDDFTTAFKENKLKSFYKKINNVPFDKAIMEKTAKVRVSVADFLWQDFGNWKTIYEILAKDTRGNVKKGDVLVFEGENNFIYSDVLKKKLLVMGLKDVFFIDTPKYTLLTSIESLGSIKSALKELKIKE